MPITHPLSFIEKPWLFLCLFLCIAQTSRGQNLQIEGILLDEQTQKPVSFANLAVCGKAFGTSSNEEGIFRLNLPSSFQKDTLCISCIGYQTMKLAISALRSGSRLELKLTPNTKKLSEITITDRKLPSGVQVVRKAIKKITRNYPTRPYLMEGYYRDYLEDANGYSYLQEAAIGIFDGGFQTQDTETRINVYQTRYNKGFPIEYADHYENNLGGRSGHINFVGGNTLSVMMYNNPIRNYNRISDIKTGYELDEHFVPSHDFDLEYISYLDGEEVYNIKVTANQKHMQFENLYRANIQQAAYHLEGRMYIRAKDYAILRFDYQVDMNKNGHKSRLNQLRLEYKEYQGKLYLNYVSFANFITIKRDTSSKNYTHFREMFINRVRTEDLPPLDTFYLFSRIQQLHNQSHLSDPSFWEAYNMVLMRKEEE